MLFSVGCYNPDLGGEGAFTCKADKACPDGFTCNTGTFVCEKNGSSTVDSGLAADTTVDGTITPKDGLTPPHEWICNIENILDLPFSKVTSRTIGLSFDDDTKDIWLAFHTADSTNNFKVYRLNRERESELVKTRLAPNGEHAAILPPVAGAGAYAAYDARSGFALADMDSLPLPIGPVISDLKTGIAPTLMPLGNKRFLLTHVMQFPEMNEFQLESVVASPEGRGQEVSQDSIPLAEGYFGVGEQTRGAFTPTDRTLAYFGRGLPSNPDAMQVLYSVYEPGANNEPGFWRPQLVVGSTKISPIEFRGLGMAYIDGRPWIAYPQPHGSSPSQVFLSDDGALGAPVLPLGWEVERPLGKPALAAASPVSKLGMALVDKEGVVHFTFAAEPYAAWTPVVTLAGRLPSLARVEIDGGFTHRDVFRCLPHRRPHHSGTCFGMCESDRPLGTHARPPTHPAPPSSPIPRNY
ncbi:MAG: hypothetical protein JRH20_20670 [Deltaproteobacteria bacterium]|nr:hypothetical protein [Deltaproteobacteria bacterium]